MLEYADLGDTIENSTIKITDEETFYLAYLNEIRTNGDGMPYNYILYVPKILQTAYRNGGGIMPDSGYPFWWYMSTFKGLSKEEIDNDWEKVLDSLLNQGLLPFPTGKVGAPYSSDGVSLPVTAKNIFNETASLPHDSKIHVFFGDQNYAGFNRNLCLVGPLDENGFSLFRKDDKYIMYLPAAIRDKYISLGGSDGYYTSNVLSWYYISVCQQRDFSNLSLANYILENKDNLPDIESISESINKTPDSVENTTAENRIKEVSSLIKEEKTAFISSDHSGITLKDGKTIKPSDFCSSFGFFADNVDNGKYYFVYPADIRNTYKEAGGLHSAVDKYPLMWYASHYYDLPFDPTNTFAFIGQIAIMAEKNEPLKELNVSDVDAIWTK